MKQNHQQEDDHGTGKTASNHLLRLPRQRAGIRHPGIRTISEACTSVAEKLSAALYIRLSREDEADGPSESVTNQRSMLEQYAADRALTVYDVYIDDGWSGCNFDRPAFQRMLTDIESGRVNMVITKDLSRLGRDYILTGHYLERYFPEHRVRYISLLDGIDTGSDSSANDITPFRAIMNDLYARDISRKITSVKRNKQRQGQFIGGKPVFGYRMHPTEKNRIVVDEEAAPVVRRIFSAALAGISCRAIAGQLNREGIPSPAVYAGLAPDGHWSGERISEMLQNETYLGSMVQGRRVKISYKSKKSLRQKKSDWVVVENTHEPIIDRETFNAVQILLSGRARTRSRTYDHPLKGILLCHECAQPLSLVNRKNRSGSDTLYFICRTYQRHTREKLCTAHCVRADAVTDAVLSVLRAACGDALTPEVLHPIADEVLQRQSVPAETHLHALNAQLQQVTARIDRLCLSHLGEAVNAADFDRIYRQLCLRRTQLSEQFEAAKKEPPPPDAGKLTAQYLAEIWKERETLAQLIERAELTCRKELFLFLRFAAESTP